MVRSQQDCGPAVQPTASSRLPQPPAEHYQTALRVISYFQKTRNSYCTLIIFGVTLTPSLHPSPFHTAHTAHIAPHASRHPPHALRLADVVLQEELRIHLDRRQHVGHLRPQGDHRVSHPEQLGARPRPTALVRPSLVEGGNVSEESLVEEPLDGFVKGRHGWGQGDEDRWGGQVWVRIGHTRCCAQVYFYRCVVVCQSFPQQVDRQGCLAGGFGVFAGGREDAFVQQTGPGHGGHHGVLGVFLGDLNDDLDGDSFFGWLGGRGRGRGRSRGRGRGGCAELFAVDFDGSG